MNNALHANLRSEYAPAMQQELNANIRVRHFAARTIRAVAFTECGTYLSLYIYIHMQIRAALVGTYLQIW